jgi:hypothetical protein
MVIHDLDDDWFYLHFRKTSIFWLLSWDVLGGLGMSWDVTGRSGTLWKGHLQLYLPLSHCLHSCRGARSNSNLHKIQTMEGVKFHHVSPIQDPCQSSTEGSEGLKAGRDAASLQLPNPMTSSGSTSSDSQPSCPWGARQHDLDHLWINQIWVCMKMIEHVWKTTQFPWFSIIFLIKNHYSWGYSEYSPFSDRPIFECVLNMWYTHVYPPKWQFELEDDFFQAWRWCPWSFHCQGLELLGR